MIKIDAPRIPGAMTIPFKKLKDEWVKSPSFRAEYERLKPEYALALSQVELEEAGAGSVFTVGRAVPPETTPSRPRRRR